ncbi:plastocyanin/azurin family copper-binding protein [Halorussus salinisoli]|uniref:plastocyanin/azurin family copper-binding protein n=1 Tax=Halorussus salinisoli TaxID=2558242 RepID=UPI0010C1AFD7|nr:plastocyanin/azurin family copper-binding protein [Halorussus salinisoli]
MRRRTFLSGVSAVGVGGLAGCGAPTGGNETETTAGGDTTTETTTEAGTTEGEGTEGGTTADEQGAQGSGPIAMITDGSEYYFDPIGLFVQPGTTVEWVNESGAHSSTAYAEGTGGASVTRIPEDADPWNSEIISEEGGTFSYTFEVEGTYDYFCIPHKTLGMVGRVVCGEPGGPAEGSMPPDGDVPESQAIVDQGAISYEEFSG